MEKQVQNAAEIKPDQLKKEDRRKGAQTLYTNLLPLNVDNRIRIESNYTTRSGERLADVAEVGSLGRRFPAGTSILSSSKKPSVIGGRDLQTPVSMKSKQKSATVYGGPPPFKDQLIKLPLN